MAVATLLVIVLAFVGGCSDGQKPTKASTGGTSATQSVGSDSHSVVDFTPDGWTMVTLADGSQVFGAVTESAQDAVFYLRDAFFVAGKDSSDVNQLRPFGLEVHRPEQLLVVPWTSVVYQEPLTAEAAAVVAIKTYREANPATATPEPELDAGSMAAVFLHNGEVYFGNLSVDGPFASISNAHFLRFKDSAAADTGSITSLDQVELIPQAQAAAGSTGEMIVPLDSILYMQLLAVDSPVSAALSPEQ